MPTENKRSGLKIPGGILQPTTPPEGPPSERGGAGEPAADEPAPAGATATGDDPVAGEPRTSRNRRRRPSRAVAEKVEGRRLYLSEGVHFRLRIYAYQKGLKLSEAAEELLDRTLPKYDVNRIN